MTDKLSLYNGALRMLRDRSLASLSQVGESRRLLDAAWDEGAVKACLEAGQWKHAKRSVQIDYDPALETDFGYSRVFTQPDDYVRTIGVWSDEMMQCPYEDHRNEGGFWYANIDTIYVAYVSLDVNYGGDFSLWPMSFVKFVQAHLAFEIAGPLTEKGQEMGKAREFFLREALSKDAMSDPTRQLPAGSWVRARGLGRGTLNGQPR